jgi:hypothetical protein
MALKYLRPITGAILTTDQLIGYHHHHVMGIRSYNLLVPLSICALPISKRIAQRVDISIIEHGTQCDDRTALEELKYKLLPTLASHPHTTSIIIVGAGCESIQAREVAAELHSLNPAIEYITVSDDRSTESAIINGANSASNLILQSMPGLGVIETPLVAIGFSEAPKLLNELIAKLNQTGISTSCFEFGRDQERSLQEFMLGGSHAILSFTPGDQYPSGTILTPVINVASSSDFHARFLDDFDVKDTNNNGAIAEKVMSVFQRNRTFSEYTRTFGPLRVGEVEGQLPEITGIQNLIAIVPLNCVFQNLAEDISKNSESVLPINYFGSMDAHLLDAIIASLTQAPYIRSIILLTSGSSDELQLLENSNLVKNTPTIHILHLSEYGSLFAFAVGASQTIKKINADAAQ